MQIKSFRGNSLSELDKEVNIFLSKHFTAEVLFFNIDKSSANSIKNNYTYIVKWNLDKEQEYLADEILSRKNGIL